MFSNLAASNENSISLNVEIYLFFCSSEYGLELAISYVRGKLLDQTNALFYSKLYALPTILEFSTLRDAV